MAELPEGLKLIVTLEGGASQQFADRDSFIIGRAEGADFRAEVEGVSEEHLRVSVQDGKLWLTDLGSDAGTFVNGEKLPAFQRIRHDPKNRIFLGESLAVIRIKPSFRLAAKPAPAPAPEPVPVPESISPAIKNAEAEASAILERAKAGAKEIKEQAEGFAQDVLGKWEIGRRELETLDTRKRDLDADIEKKTVHSTELEAAVAGKARELSTLEQDLSGKVEKLSEVQKTLAALETEYDAASARNKELSDLLDSEESRLEKIRNSATELETQSERSRAEAEHAKQTLAAATEERNALQEQVQSLTTRLSHLKLHEERAETEKHLLAAQEEFARMESHLASTLTLIREQEASLNKLTFAKEALESEHQALVQEHQATRQALVIETGRLEQVEKRVDVAAHLFSETESSIARASAELGNLRSEIQRLSVERNTLDGQYQTALQTHQELCASIESDSRDLAALKSHLQKLLEERSGVEESVRELIEQRDRMDREKSEIQGRILEMRSESESLEQERDRIKQEHAEASMEFRKLKHERDTEEVDNKLRVAKMHLETQQALAEKLTIDNQLVAVRNEVEHLTDRRKDLEESLADAKERMERVRRDTSNLQDRSEELSRDLAEQTARFDELKREIPELERVKARTETEIADRKDLAEQDLRQMRERLEREANSRADEIIQLAKSHAQTLKESADKEYGERKKKMDLEIAQMKVVEIQEAKDRRAQEESAAKKRREHEIQEVSRTIRDIVGSQIAKIVESQGNFELIEKALEEVNKSIVRVMRGETSSEPDEGLKKYIPFNPQATANLKKFKIKAALSVGIPAAVLLISIIFPRFFPAIGEGISGGVRRTIASAPKDHLPPPPKFSPKMDRAFKETYAQNVLYTEGYTAFKTDEKLHNDWVLQLNGFLMRELGFNENAIVPVITAEANLVRELVKLREFIIPAYEREGIQRMMTAEENALPELKGLLKGEGNYARFRQFEREFFQKFAAQKQ